MSKALAPMIRQYPQWIYYSGVGGRMLREKNWNSGVKGNMPQHYKDFYFTWRKGPQEHIHSRVTGARFEKDEWGEIHPVQNPRIYVVYPDTFHEGLWGGEGVIKAVIARPVTRHVSNKRPPAKYLWPRLLEGVVYSEILNKHIDMVMTQRGVRLVDEANGFDNYILNTPVNEIYAWKLLKLKREMLLHLCDKENFAGRGSSTDIYEKYSSHIVDHEKADWTGLTLNEAHKKQIRIDRSQRDAGQIPLKDKFREELLQMLKDGHLDDLDVELLEKKEESGILSGIKNVFK